MTKGKISTVNSVSVKCTPGDLLNMTLRQDSPVSRQWLKHKALICLSCRSGFISAKQVINKIQYNEI